MGWFTEWRRRRVLRHHRMDDALWQRATRRLTFLPPSAKLREMALLFLAEKEFAGAHELEVSDEMRVSIAAQACLPVLELGLDWYRGWRGIVVYPGDFRVRREEMDEHGVVHEWDDELAGESWPGGPVVLSWEALDDAGSVAEGGVNVVIHEFAHKLDMRAGEADGVPPMPTREAHERWLKVFDAEFDRFCGAIDSGKETFLDPYAAEHESEFFAVASEAFFESPHALKRDFPALYDLFRGFYRQDPAKRLKA